MKLKYLSWIPAIIIMILIFCFSSKPADNSNESSMTVVNKIFNFYENITDSQYQPAQISKIKESLNHIVRKSAHFCEYALLAMAIAFHLSVWKRKGKVLFLLPVVISCLYAITDEFHQTFVPGRAGLWKDAMLDTSGAATGTLLFVLILIILESKRLKNSIRIKPLV